MLRVEKPLEEKFKNKTEADERKIVDFETARFINRLKKVEESFKYVKVTHVNVRISTPVYVTYKTWWQKAAGNIGKFFYDLFHKVDIQKEIKEQNG